MCFTVCLLLPLSLSVLVPSPVLLLSPSLCLRVCSHFTCGYVLGGVRRVCVCARDRPTLRKETHKRNELSFRNKKNRFRPNQSIRIQFFHPDSGFVPLHTHITFDFVLVVVIEAYVRDLDIVSSKSLELVSSTSTHSVSFYIALLHLAHQLKRDVNKSIDTVCVTQRMKKNRKFGNPIRFTAEHKTKQPDRPNWSTNGCVVSSVAARCSSPSARIDVVGAVGNVVAVAVVFAVVRKATKPTVFIYYLKRSISPYSNIYRYLKRLCVRLILLAMVRLKYESYIRIE